MSPKPADASVSVIIPCFNRARYLAKAIESVIAQTWQPTEIIVVDDGSNDDTQAVAQEYGSRVTYLYKPNGGPSSARNLGIRHASGTHLAFLDSDDWWHPAFLRTLIEASRQHGDPCLAYCRQLLADQYGVPLAVPAFNGAMHDDVVLALIGGNRVTADAVVVDASCVRQVGAYDESLRSNEDWDLWLRLAESGVPFIFVPRTLAFYRQHPEGSHFDLGPNYASHVAVLGKHAGARYDAEFRRTHRESMARGVLLQASHAVGTQGVDMALRLAGEVIRTYHEELTGRPDHFIAMIDALSTAVPPDDDSARSSDRQAAELLLRALPRTLSTRKYNDLVGIVFLALALTQLRGHHWREAARALVIALRAAPALAVHSDLRKWLGAVIRAKGPALLPYSLRPAARYTMIATPRPASRTRAEVGRRQQSNV